MIRWLLRTIFGCAHEHRYREIIDHQLWLICDRCLDAQLAIRRESGFVRSGRQAGTRQATADKQSAQRPVNPVDSRQDKAYKDKRPETLVSPEPVPSVVSRRPAV